MQLICPECLARYRVSSSALGEEGRDVRCAKCSHEWFEVPENLEADAVAPDIVEPDIAPMDKFEDNHVDESVDAFDDRPVEVKDEPETERTSRFDKIDDGADDSFALGDAPVTQQDEQETTAHEAEDIPDSVKPIDEKGDNATAVGTIVKPQTSLQAKLMGYIMALLVFAILIAGAIMFKKQIISAWLPSAAIYELAGFPLEFQGQHLVMENLTAKAQRDVDGKNYLILEGRVINLTNEVQYVPPLVAQLRSTSGEDSEMWPIDTPLQRLEPGESFTFKSDYPALPDGSGSVNLSFKPTLKR